MSDNELTLGAKIGPRRHTFARRTGLAGFWRWWIGQLAEIVPSGLSNTLERRRLRPVLVFDAQEAILWQPALARGPPAMKRATAISLTDDPARVASAGRSALLSSLRGTYGGVRGAHGVIVALSPRDVLRKSVRLPAAVEENLRQVLAYDLDRHTPFKPDELYFDAVVVGRDAVRNEIVVDLASARRTAIDPAIKHAAAWGATVLAVVPDDPAQAASSQLNLLPPDARPLQSAWQRWQIGLPLALLIVLSVAAMLIPLWQKRESAIALNILADQARSQAAVSEALRQDLEAKAGDYNFALMRKYAFPSTMQVIDDVSRLLPDDTWLTQFELKSVARGKDTQREVLLRGETANAGRLVGVFEESQLFTQAAPRSPTTKIQPGPGEIFDLGAQLKRLSAPPAIALTAAEKASAAPSTTPESATAPAAPTASSRAAATPPASPPAAPAVPPRAPASAAPAPPVAVDSAAPSAPQAKP
ncbi:MAG: hypothetical protein WKH97_07270 [Casimicrobiaceae bacterium]